MSLPPPSKRQARIIWLALTGLAAAALVGLVVGLVWGLGRVLNVLSPVLWPLAVAGVLAYLLDPLVGFMERKGASRTRAVASVFGLSLLLIAALLAGVVPPVVSQATDLANRIPDYAAKLEKRADYWFNHPPPFVRALLERGTPPPSLAPTPAAQTNVVIRAPAAAMTNNPASTNAPPVLAGGLDKESLQSAAGWVAQALRKAGAWLVEQVASWAGMVVGLVLVPIYTFFFLLEKERIADHWTNYLPVTDSRFKKELIFVLESINNYLIAFFRGQVLVAFCNGALYGIGFLIIGLPYAVLLGAMAIILTMVPFLGAIVTCITALLVALLQFGDWQHLLLVLVVFSVVQALEALVISPWVMGGKVGLHPLTIIVAVMAGTTLLGGLLGGVLAIPFTAALRVVMFRYVWKRRDVSEDG